MLKRYDFKVKYGVFAGIILLGMYLVIRSDYPTPENHFTLCILHKLTGYPCTACGTGRSLIFIRYGSFYDALYTNPMGYLVLGFGIMALVWMSVDLIRKKETFFQSLNIKVHPIFIAIIAIATILNWIWNIYKGI